jgi:hypothetical protein
MNAAFRDAGSPGWTKQARTEDWNKPETAARVTTLQATLDHLEHFRPGKPSPTHRCQQLPASGF